MRQEANADMLAVLHYMLERIALDPSEVQRMRNGFATGQVKLHFFRWANLENLFFLHPSSPEHTLLMQAFERNLASKMFRAAEQALRWSSLDKVFAGQRHENARDKANSAKRQWCTPIATVAAPTTRLTARSSVVFRGSAGRSIEHF